MDNLVKHLIASGIDEDQAKSIASTMPTEVSEEHTEENIDVERLQKALNDISEAMTETHNEEADAAVAEAQSEIDTLKVRRCKESSRPLADTLSKWASTPERRLQRVGRRVSLGPQNASTKHFLDAGTPFDLESRATEG